MVKTLIYAHRGASKLAPENTMPAFELAYNAGADGIETDVQLTKDQVPVLLHDENLRRTTNGTGFVQDYTYKELKKLDAGSWFASKFSDTSIVTLEAFLRWFQTKSMKLNLELKNNVIDYKDLEKHVYDLLVSYGQLSNTVISSFNSESITRFKRIDSSIQLAFLTSQKTRNLPAYAEKIGANNLHIKYRLLNKRLVKQCHRRDMPIRIYTVNRPIQMRKCMRTACDGIFTDVPHLALEYRDVVPSD
ncbi:glycerophosphodiester phosphodiesterase [Thalassobacillus sp. CUG 92003]|uniref:glycerophosphodiester phosphodiesterase n=1 Tax=Thalassobacillus sp. CUG 92003 TaxID=2736641 RepID=UPI0015E7D2B7|nr:glycerophosphodiester phosphodiesterase [Thalassobacillus sp. CUG 92003]